MPPVAMLSLLCRVQVNDKGSMLCSYAICVFILLALALVFYNLSRQ